MFWLMLGLNMLVAMLGAAILFWPGGLRALRFVLALPLVYLQWVMVPYWLLGCATFLSGDQACATWPTLLLGPLPVYQLLYGSLLLAGCMTYRLKRRQAGLASVA